MIPVNDYHDWDYSNPVYLTCKNHLELRWLWKGPGRNLHFLWTSAASNEYRECECAFADLRVMVEGPLTKEQAHREFVEEVTGVTIVE